MACAGLQSGPSPHAPACPSALRDALAWLQAAGAVFREYRHNTSTSYTVCPKRFDPAKAPAESKRTTKRKTDVAANAAPCACRPGCRCRPTGKCRSTPANAAPAPADAAGLEGQMPPPNHQLNRHLTANEPSPPALQSGRDGAGQPENTEEPHCRQLAERPGRPTASRLSSATGSSPFAMLR
jgi:hypothetical protein